MMKWLCEGFSLAHSQTVKEVGILTRHLLNLSVKVLKFICAKLSIVINYKV